MDIWISLFWLLWILLWIFTYKFLCGFVFNSLQHIPRSETVLSNSNCLKSCQTAAIPFYIPKSSVWSFLYTLTNTFFFLIIAILVGVKWYLIVVSICISLLTNDIKHLFLCVYWPLVYFLWRKVYSDPLTIEKIGWSYYCHYTWQSCWAFQPEDKFWDSLLFHFNNWIFSHLHHSQHYLIS